VLDGTDVVYVLRVSTRAIMRISLAAGSRLPAYCASLGRVLLASLPDEAARAVLLQSERAALTRHTLTDIDALMGQLQLARQQGWALVDQELEEGLISLAAPVVGRDGKVLAAINVSGQANRSSAAHMQATMLGPLREAAAQIGQLLAAR
jgi:IclR family pca regulon transcriptional regulator